LQRQRSLAAVVAAGAAYAKPAAVPLRIAAMAHDNFGLEFMLRFPADTFFYQLVARARHKASEPASTLHPSIADRFFIAMLFSDAPMPICDILVRGFAVILRGLP
jgi:hypothetical protein